MKRKLLLLFLAALSVRLAAAVVLHADESALASAHHEHASIARSLAEGRGFRFNFFGDEKNPDLTSQQAPLVPSFLAGCHLLFGIETRASLRAAIGFQCLISALTVLAIFAASTRLSDRPSVQWSAAALASLYPPLIVAPLHVQALVWNLFWLSMMLATALALMEKFRVFPASVFTLAAAGGILTDPILAAPALVMMGCTTFRRTSSGTVQRLLPAGAVVAGVAVCISPWLIRNYQVHGRFVFIKDSFGYVFWQGNNSASFGTDKLPAEGLFAESTARQLNPLAAIGSAQAARGVSRSVDSTLSTAELHELRALPNEIARMDWFRDRIVRELRANPLQYLRMCAVRLGIWATFDPTNPRSLLIHYRVGCVGLLLLAIIGVMSVKPAGLSRKSWLPVLLCGCTLTAVHVAIITSARFRVPLEMLMVLPAAVGASRIFELAIVAARFRREHSSRPSLPVSPVPAFAE